jgi:orotidine-5'-phosphate decarboxylase
MNQATQPISAPGAADRIIVALDVETAAEARRIFDEIYGRVGAFKIGLQLFLAAGPGFIRELTSAGGRIFLDLKFHDIPNTVAKAAIEASRLGVWMFNVHASAGREALLRTRDDVAEVCDKEKIERPRMVAVTVLTSSDANTMKETGIECTVEQQVLKLARLTAESGLDGVVASPLEASAIRSSIREPGFLIVTPGVRPQFATKNDQKRVTTPAAAIAAGSDYVVIGRPITQSANRLSAVDMICREIDSTFR